MKKNLVVLAMSTLPKQKKETYFTYKEEPQEEIPYISQLEPTSLMIKKLHHSLDRVLILATSETLEKDALYDNKSAVEVYLENVKLNKEDAEIIGLEERNFIPAISETVKAIRNYWEENNGNVNLWIDTQGGFRNITLVLTAIITLLESDGIVPSGIYSLNYNFLNRVNPIETQTGNYKVFQFVSGINEFSRSGRAEQLLDYYRDMGLEVPEIINYMKDIAWDIQMCDMLSFDKHLEELRSLEISEENGLLGMFIDQIKRDYGKLCSDDWTGLDVAEWFYKKGFYQQAITYIESKMPAEWVKGTGPDARGKLMGYNFISGNIEDLKSALKKDYEKDENIIVTQIGMACFYKQDIHSVCMNGRHEEKIYNALRRKQNRNVRLQQLPVVVKYKGNVKFNGKVSVRLMNHVDEQKFLRLIGLYMLLKNERNNFNHMSDKDTRASKEELGEIIRLFIETGKEIYAEKDIH